MAFEERVQILSEAEQDELYGPPAFTSADQRFFFSLNDKELAIAKSLRHRGQRYMLVVLLGYFKAKPVVLNPGFHQIKQDLKYVYQTVLPGPGCRPFNLTPKENERIYQRGVLGIFRPKTTKCSGGPAVCGLQRGITFFEIPIWALFE